MCLYIYVIELEFKIIKSQRKKYFEKQYYKICLAVVKLHSMLSNQQLHILKT